MKVKDLIMLKIKILRFSRRLLSTALSLASISSFCAQASPQANIQYVLDTSGRTVASYKNSVALVIYVDKYSKWRPLPHTAKEASLVKKALEEQGFLVRLVENPKTYTDLNGALHEFSAYYNFRKDVDRVIIFFTGHGFSRSDVGYLIPADTPKPIISKTADDPDFYNNTLLMEELYQRIANTFQNRHILIVLDSCNSGSIFAEKPTSSPSATSLSYEAINNQSRQVITAGGANEEVPAKSIFTPLFIKALSGAADRNGKGFVTGSDIAAYIVSQMKQEQSQDYPQSPQYGRITKISEREKEQGEIIFASNQAGVISATKLQPRIALDDELSLKRRSQYTVEYFGSSRVKDENLVRIVLKRLGFSGTQLNSVLDAKEVDSLWVGGRVNVEDVKLLANTLIQDGLKLKAIRSFPKTPWHPNPDMLAKIQLGADRDLQKECKPLSVDQIQNAIKIDRTSLVCGRE